MKKLIMLLILIGLSLLGGITTFALETINYNIVFYEDRAWDITDGSFDVNDNYWSTNKLKIVDDEITLNNLYFHHILFWDSVGRYMGYYNTTDGGYEGSKYLGDTDETVDLPLDASWFSLTAYENTPLDIPRSELNNNTLSEIFEDALLFDDYQLVTNGDFNNGSTGWSSVSSNISVTNGILKAISTAIGTYGISRSITATGVDKQYSFMLVKNSIGGNLSHYIGNSGFKVYSVVANNWQVISFIGNTSITTFRVYSENNTIGDYIEIDKTGYFNISTLISNKQYSPLFSTTFDLMSDANIKTQMDYWVESPYKWLHYDDLGWYPTQEVQNYWESIWYTYYIGGWEDGLTILLFYSMEATYDRDVTLPESQSFLESLEDKLDSLGLGMFPRIAVALAVMIGLGVVMLVFKVPSTVTFIFELLLYVLFTLMQWFPVWIVIVVAIGLLLTLIIKRGINK